MHGHAWAQNYKIGKGAGEVGGAINKALAENSAHPCSVQRDTSEDICMMLSAFFDPSPGIDITKRLQGNPKMNPYVDNIDELDPSAFLSIQIFFTL